MWEVCNHEYRYGETLHVCNDGSPNYIINSQCWTPKRVCMRSDDPISPNLTQSHPVSPNWHICRFAHWHICPLAHWPIGPLTHWPIGRFAHWPIGPPAHWPIGPLAHRPICALAHWRISPLALWPIAHLTLSGLSQSHPASHSLTQSFCYYYY